MINLLVEITEWKGNTPCHSYIVDGFKCLGYIPQGTKTSRMFSKPMDFDRKGRSFKIKAWKQPSTTDDIRNVTGSKGDAYSVNVTQGRCSCPGFQFRGTCKHLSIFSN